MIRTLQLGHETQWSRSTFGSSMSIDTVVLNASPRKPYLAGGRANRVGVG